MLGYFKNYFPLFSACMVEHRPCKNRVYILLVLVGVWPCDWGPLVNGTRGLVSWTGTGERSSCSWMPVQHLAQSHPGIIPGTDSLYGAGVALQEEKKSLPGGINPDNLSISGAPTCQPARTTRSRHCSHPTLPCEPGGVGPAGLHRSSAKPWPGPFTD